jgi:predicted RNA-binding protein YlqC (UPF0109 family)
MAQFDPNDVREFLSLLAGELLPIQHDVGKIDVEHKPGVPFEGEHLFVVSPPPEFGGLLVGSRGRTAEAIRTIARTFCMARDWDERIDVRIRKTA